MKYLHFVRDAVYAFAHALHNLHREMCPDAPGRVCDAMRDSDGSVLKFYLEKANFEGRLTCSTSLRWAGRSFTLSNAFVSGNVNTKRERERERADSLWGRDPSDGVATHEFLTAGLFDTRWPGFLL